MTQPQRRSSGSTAGHGRHGADELATSTTSPTQGNTEVRPSPRREGSPSVSHRYRSLRNQRRASRPSVDYDIPDSYRQLDEVAVGEPVQNPDEEPVYRHESLEQVRTRDREDHPSDRDAARRDESQEQQKPEQVHHVSRLATQVYTISYLVLFSILGTLARLGLQWLTDYPGAPVFTSVWFNFGGSLVMGFLSEDRMLFRYEWGTPTYDRQIKLARRNGQDEGSGISSDRTVVDLTAAKKTIPLYVGLATGFCGSFTSFSAFIRDVFLALSNDLHAPGTTSTAPRNGGYSFMAVLAVIIITVSASVAGLFAGAHLAIALEPITPSLPYLLTRKVLDRAAVLLGWGCWLGAVLLSALPPNRGSGRAETWRGAATLALVFAPLGCLARFYVSLHLNGRFAAFPFGTFAVNVFGTAVLGMAWDLAHAPVGGAVGCQVLQGVEDGFCGCLTTVSTWVSELTALRRLHAYLYGAASVLVSLAAMVAIMGGLRWSRGFEVPACAH